MKSRALDRKLRDEEKKLSRLLEAICLKSDVRIDHQGFPIASSSDISPFPSSGQIRTIGVQVNKDELADSDEDEAFYRRFDPSQHSLERWDSIVNEQLKNDQRSQMLKMKAMLKKAHNKITELHAIILKLMQWKNSTANHVTLFLDTFQHKTKKHLSHDANTIPPHFMEDLSKTITQVKNRVEEKLELPGFVRSLHRDPKLHQFQFSAESLQDDSIADESIPSPVATEKGKQESKSNEKQTPTKSVAAEESKPKSAVSKLFSGTKHQSDKDSDSNGGWSNSDSDEGPIVSSKVPFQFNSKKDSAESVAPNFGVVLRSAPPPPPAANKPPPPPPPHVVKANKFAESQQQKLQEANATKAPSHAYTTSPAKKPFGGSPAYKKTTPTKYEVIKVEVAKGITPGVCVECRKNMDLKTIFPLVESPSALLTPVLSKKGEEIAGYLFDMLARIQASSSDKFAQELTFQRSVDASWISKRVFLLFLLLFNLYDES